MGEERKEAPGTPPPARVAVARKLQWFVSDLTVGRGKSRKTVVRGISKWRLGVARTEGRDVGIDLRSSIFYVQRVRRGVTS
jgi:hypothetical protein